MNHLVTVQYQSLAVSFTDDGWFNATAVARSYGLTPAEWWRLPATQRYVQALERKYGKIPYSKTRRGGQGGTWLHPKLAIRFAQWVDDDFAVWCDEQIERILQNVRGVGDRARLRHEAAATYKVMTSILQLTRERAGKKSASYHYINEAKLVNWALVGRFAGLDRDSLTVHELDLLAKLEEYNAVLIGVGLDYQERKHRLRTFADDWQMGRERIAA